MPYSKSLAARVRDQLASERLLVEKRLFGGLAFMLRGNLLVAVWDNSLIVRVGPAEEAAALAQPFVRPFDVTGRPMKGWVLVDPDALDSDHQLRAWLERARHFVLSLPAK